jgi:POT family proton-dependent oligopeptide transporter
MTPPQRFPRTFYVANAIELFERMAFYGMYVGLSLYLSNVVKMNDVESGNLLGTFRLVSALAPIPCGALADRITFKRSLIIAFSLYAFGYLALFSSPEPAMATASLLCIGVGGGFMKPVILGTVIRTAPEGREGDGFAIFYRMVNAGSVIGKTLAWRVRVAIGMRFVMINSVIASLAALGLAIFAYREPSRGNATTAPLSETLRGYGTALRNLKLTVFLVLFGGFYFMSDQFYFTFPKYVTRHIDPKAPLELVTLINPALIAIFQSRIAAIFSRFHPVTTIVMGMLVGSLSMLVMGVAPGLAGACLSGAIFAFAEMICSPRFFAYVGSFAPEGRAGMYMGLTYIAQGIGSFIGGRVSGNMVARYIPAEGPRHPTTIWTLYAGLGVLCMAMLAIYRAFVVRKPQTA